MRTKSTYQAKFSLELDLICCEQVNSECSGLNLESQIHSPNNDLNTHESLTLNQ